MTPRKPFTRLTFWAVLIVLLLPACERVQEVQAPSRPAAEKPRAPHALWTNFETEANVKALALDGDDLWLGLSNGIIRYDTRTADDHEVFTTRSTQGALLSNGIYAIEVGADGRKWIGTYGGGLSSFDGHRWTTYTPYGGGSPVTYGDQWQIYPMGSGLGDLWVYDMAFDEAGDLWIATWKGVSKFDGKTFTNYTTRDGLIDQWVYAIEIDREGVFWFGTEGGVTRFDGSSWQSYTHDDGLGADFPASTPDTYRPPSLHHTTSEKTVSEPNPNYILSMAVDRNNHKWFGTWGAGLSRFDGQEWKTYTMEDGLSGNFVHAVKQDPEGNIWVGTEGGISRFDGNSWKNYNTGDGLLDNNVFSIAFDQKGNKWFGTWSGLSKFQEP